MKDKLLDGNCIAEIKSELKHLEEEEFYLEMADIQSEAEKKRLRGIRNRQRELESELKKLEEN